MGAVFRPRDLRNRRKIVEDAVRDLGPDARDDVIKILRSWEGTASEEKLKEILGQDKARELMRRIKKEGKQLGR